MNSYTILTGASSGIGLEYAHLLASKGHNLILIARRAQRLEELKREILIESNVDIIIFDLDLTATGSIERIYNYCTEKNIFINQLINNAGIGLFEYFHKSSEEQIQKLIKLNIEVPTKLTRTFLPKMIEINEGQIQFIASIASYLPTPLYSVYGGTKAYLKNFGISLHYELQETKIKVNVLNPGLTKTEFFDTAKQKNSWSQRVQMMSAKKCAEYSHKALIKNKASSLPGLLNNYTVHILLRFTPLFIQAKIILKDLLKSNDKKI